MHWLEQLSEFYRADDLSLFHDMVHTEIEVSLSADGYFIGARYEQLLTVIPVTEQSVGRTCGLFPHPICDMLGFVAADFHEDTAADIRYSQGNELYLRQLCEWCATDYATEELRTLYRYLSEEKLFNELMATDVPSRFGAGKLGKAMVRFVVGDVRLWEDKSLQARHIAYMRSLGSEKDVCCLSGEHTAVIRQHPRHITGVTGVAKLISSAMLPIGRELSFRAHVVLRRLIERHGIHIGSKVFIAWDEEGRGAQMQGAVTVLVLHEVCRGSFAVSLFGSTDAERYARFAEEYPGGGDSEDALCALHRLNRLMRGLD